MWLEFLTVSLLVIASPGTGVAISIATGLSHGARTAAIAALGCTLGIVPHMLAAVTGLAAVLHASPLAFESVKFAGVGYLLYIAWKTWQEHGALVITAERSERSDRQIVQHAVLANLLNPKLSMFFLAFLPQFIPADSEAPTQTMLALSLAFMGLTFAVFAIYGALAARMRDRVLGSPRAMAWLRRSFAAAFIALGAKLALTQR